MQHHHPLQVGRDPALLTTDLHCLAIVHQRGLKSLRDLRSDHLPLLRNIREVAVTAVARKYGLQGSQVRLSQYPHLRRRSAS